MVKKNIYTAIVVAFFIAAIRFWVGFYHFYGTETGKKFLVLALASTLMVAVFSLKLIKSRIKK